MIENSVFSRNKTFTASTITSYNNEFCVFHCDQNYSQKSNQLSTGYSTQEFQNTAPFLLQHQCLTQQTISSNVNEKKFQIKRRRMVYSSSQMLYLENLFAKNKYLDRNTRLHVARQLNLSEKQIKVWYQNKRMKVKRMQKKVDSFISTRLATAVDPVVAQNGLAQSHTPFLPPMSHWHHHQQQQQIQQQEQPQQPQQQQQGREEQELQEQPGLAEQRYPNPSVTVHHYPSLNPYAPERLYNPPTTVAVVPQPFQTPSSFRRPQQQQQQRHQNRRQPVPPDATHRLGAPVQHPPYRRPVLPTYEEATAGRVQPTQQRRHAHCTRCPAVPVTPPWGRRQSGASAVTARQPSSASWPQAQPGDSPAAGHSFELAPDPIDFTDHAMMFDQRLELMVDNETLIF